MLKIKAIKDQNIACGFNKRIKDDFTAQHG